MERNKLLVICCPDGRRWRKVSTTDKGEANVGTHNGECLILCSHLRVDACPNLDA